MKNKKNNSKKDNLVLQFTERAIEHNDTILNEFKDLQDGKKSELNNELIHTMSTYIRDILNLVVNKLK